MGILTRRLEKGVTYWVCELPTNDTPFLYPELRTLTDITHDHSRALRGDNYNCTYEFDSVHIPTFLNPEVKFHMEMIGRFIVTKESAKMQMIIRNNVNVDLYENKKIDKELNIKSINEYITDVDENHPELLI